MKIPFQMLHLNALPIVVLALLTFASASASAQSDEVFSIDIESQKAGSALVKLAQSSSMHILFAEGASTQVEVEGLKGEYRFEEALAALLTGTDLTYKVVAENFVLVQQPQVEGEENAEEDEEVEEPAAAEEDEPLELSEQTVTGSRLERGDPTALIYTLTAEDIARRGVSNLEELFRTLPWAFSTINTQTNMGNQQVNLLEDIDVDLGDLGLGSSTINLRALGSANTLVLINGRRVAGLAGYEEDLINLLNIPLSAIERVEIQLDGSSAVYGADAIGGVVNFITKKNYRGISASIRNEFSETDADKSNASIQVGYAWGGGNMTAMVSRDTSKPINNFKLGTETRDYRGFFGPEFDLRYPVRTSQPGIVCDWNGRSIGCNWRAPNYRQLPPGHSGVGATADDFTNDLHSVSPILPKNGADSTILSYNVTVEQNLTDRLQIYADVLYSDHEGYQSSIPTMYRYFVPTTNAYNPFGRPVVVSYYPLREVADGNLPDPHTYAENKQRNYNVGLIWDVFGRHQVQFNITRSESERAAWRFGSTGYRRSYYDPNADAFYAALASPDPEVALNLFGDGSVQGKSFEGVYAIDTGPHIGANEVNARELSSRGQLFSLWGGPVAYAAGVETRKTNVYLFRTNGIYRADDLNVSQRNALLRQAEKPSARLTAYFMELSFPLVGDNNARPGLHSLLLSVQARRDVYKSTGRDGGEQYGELLPYAWWYYDPVAGEWTRQDRGLVEYLGSDNIVERKQTKRTTRLGLRYAPTENIALRTTWSTSFQPPLLGNTFSDDDGFPAWGFFQDPFHPDGLTGYRRYNYYSRPINPDLRPESSDNFSLAFEWTPDALPGFRWYVDWSRIDFRDKIVPSQYLLAYDAAYKFPAVVERDEAGYITLVHYTLVNISKKVSELLNNQFEYAFETRLGAFTAGLDYTRVLEEYLVIIPDTGKAERKGTPLGSSVYSFRGSLSWIWGRWTADMNAYHYPGYETKDTGICGQIVGRCKAVGGFLGGDPRPPLTAKPLTTVDLTVTYRFDNGIRVRVGGRNIFKATSPVLWSGLPYDARRWDARGQVLFVDLNWEL
jgi:iron complex outermembrane receptor protein